MMMLTQIVFRQDDYDWLRGGEAWGEEAYGNLLVYTCSFAQGGGGVLRSAK